MIHISVESYKNATVYTVAIGNRELFRVRMKDVKKVLGMKKIYLI